MRGLHLIMTIAHYGIREPSAGRIDFATPVRFLDHRYVPKFLGDRSAIVTREKYEWSSRLPEQLGQLEGDLSIDADVEDPGIGRRNGVEFQRLLESAGWANHRALAIFDHLREI